MDDERNEVLLQRSSSAKARRKALIIAVSDYDNRSSLRPLPFCEKDGNAMYSILKNQGYEIPDDWKLIGRVEGKAMKDKILEFLRKSADTDDSLLFYFSGHGVYDSFGDHFLASSDIDRKIMDENGYKFRDLEDHTKKSNAKNVITILDCCFSGAARAGKSGGDVKPAEKARGVMNDLFEEGNGRCVFASSLDVQSSYPMKGGEYSRFTYFLLEGLKGGNGAAVNEHGIVTPSKLSNYIYQNIPLLKQQKPITKTAMSGDIIIAYYPELAEGREQETPLLQLLTANVKEFNEIRNRDNYPKLDFRGIDLRKKNLKSINLEAVNLSGAKLTSVNLSKARLSEADLSNARLLGARLSEADLSWANLSGTELSWANLSGANLASSIIIGVKLAVVKNKINYPQCVNATFNSETIIDDKKLRRHFHNSGSKNVPPAIKDKKELRKRLEKRGFDGETIDRFLSLSSLAKSG